jgi:hypothetical protein
MLMVRTLAVARRRIKIISLYKYALVINLSSDKKLGIFKSGV